MKKSSKICKVLIISSMLISLTACSGKESISQESTSQDVVSKSQEVATNEGANATYYYGVLNLSYADYYYGELNSIEPEEASQSIKGKYDVENLVVAAGFTDEGMYDAVTSATTSKAKMFESTFTEDTETGVNILGPSNVNVAITKALYDDVQNAIKDGTECKNGLVDLVKNLQNVSESQPIEYKVINSNGTISKTIGNTVKAENIAATMSTSSSWGNYELELEGLELESSTMQGGIIETSDGKKYGLEHLDNLWRNPREIAFSVEAFVDSRTNVAGYKRFEDIQGKTITKVTYLMANADDVEVDLSFFCKYKPEGESNITVENITYDTMGTQIPISLQVPSDSNYELVSVRKGRNSLEVDDVEYKEGVITLNSELKAGEYRITFGDEKYTDIRVSFIVDSGLAEGAVVFQNNKLAIMENTFNITLADYLVGITSVSLNGEQLRGSNLGTIIFNEDGSVNLDAKVTSRGEETPVFTEEGTYSIALEAAGYPSIEITVSR